MGKNFVVLGGPTRAEKVDRLVKDPKAWARALTSESELAALAATPLATRRDPPPNFSRILALVLVVATFVAGVAAFVVLSGWATLLQVAWSYLALSLVAAMGLLVSAAHHSRRVGFRIRLSPRPVLRRSRARELADRSYPDARDKAYRWLGYSHNMENGQDLDI